MAKGPMYVKDFNFSSAGKTVGRCNDGMTKMASGGYYSKGGSAKAGQSVQMAKSNAVAKSLVGQKATPYAKGGMKEAATGEMYPSRRAMMKHESMETPRMQREEVMQSRTVKAPMRRQMPVAPTAPMIQPGGMKKGGFVKGGEGMIKSSGTLGIKGNKNPGEKNGKPTTATKRGNVPFKKGGEVNCYADGGKAAPVPVGALNRMAAQQAKPRAPTPDYIRSQMRENYNRDVNDPKFRALPIEQQKAYTQNYQQALSQAKQISKQQMPQYQQAMREAQQMPPQGMQQPQQMPTQTMLAGSQPMPPGMQPGQQPSQQQMQQMIAQFQAARAGQGMPGGQQAPVGLGQPLGGAPAGAMPPPGYGFGNSQNAPPQSFYNGTPSAPSPQMASYAQQGLGRLGQGMGQPLGGPQPMPTQQGMQQQSQFNGGGIGQYGGAVGQMGMGMGEFS